MIESAERATAKVAKEYHHGRTPAAWAGSIIAAVAFILVAVAGPGDRIGTAPDGARTILR